MDGLVYASTCSSCGSAASRFVKMGTDRTTAFNARTGRTVWRNNAGKYASPIIADRTASTSRGARTCTRWSRASGRSEGEAEAAEGSGAGLNRSPA